jgi:hypothetical protein
LAELERFLSRYRRLWDPVWASVLWRIAAFEAVQPRLAPPSSAIGDSRVVWLLEREAESNVETHPVILISETHLVDLASRRFDPDAPVPRIWPTVDEAGAEWRFLVDAAAPTGPRRRLAPTCHLRRPALAYAA